MRHHAVRPQHLPLLRRLKDAGKIDTELDFNTITCCIHLEKVIKWMQREYRAEATERAELLDDIGVNDIVGPLLEWMDSGYTLMPYYCMVFTPDVYEGG